MGVYRGTGYFISVNALKGINISDIQSAYPNILAIFLKEDSEQKIPGIFSFYDLLKASNYATKEPIFQYDEQVCFAGTFKKYFDENTIDPDSGDAEMVEKLLTEDGYTYAVSNEDESDHILETLDVLLKKFKVLSAHEISETYWFMMPYGESKIKQET